MEKKEIIGRNIQRIRKSNGINQDYMAETLGVSPATLSLYETGKRSPKTSMLEKIAEVLQVPISVLFNGPTESLHVSLNEKAKGDDIDNVSMEELFKYWNVVEAVGGPDSGVDHGKYADLVKNYGEILKKLEGQSYKVRDLRVQLDFATKVLQNLTKR